MENILILSISIMFAAIVALIFAFAYILVQIKLPKVETQELKKREKAVTIYIMRSTG